MCPRQESNLHIQLRRLVFYPLNYRGLNAHVLYIGATKTYQKIRAQSILSQIDGFEGLTRHRKNDTQKMLPGRRIMVVRLLWEHVAQVRFLAPRHFASLRLGLSQVEGSLSVFGPRDKAKCPELIEGLQ